MRQQVFNHWFVKACFKGGVKEEEKREGERREFCDESTVMQDRGGLLSDRDILYLLLPLQTFLL